MRMSTNRESDSVFIDAKYYADVVYNKWIFDVPKILDICTLYGSFNSRVRARPLLLAIRSSADQPRTISGGQTVRVVVVLASAKVQGRSASSHSCDLPSGSGEKAPFSPDDELGTHLYAMTFDVPARKWKSVCNN